MVRVRPSPAACSPLDRSRSAGPQPLVEACQVMSLTNVAPPCVLGVTRTMTVPCAGTEALIVPVVVVTVLDHRSNSRYEDDAGSHASAGLVEIVCAELVSLNSATAKSPLDSGRDSTCNPLVERTSRACTPRVSWSTAITSRLPRMFSVAAL